MDLEKKLVKYLEDREKLIEALVKIEGAIIAIQDLMIESENQIGEAKEDSIPKVKKDKKDVQV